MITCYGAQMFTCLNIFMLISGIQQFTMLDFPEKTACIIFTPGCNFRCGYCHNPEFVLPEKIREMSDSFIPEDAVFSFLEQRRGLLDGVVVTGGEPTLMGDLPVFLRRIKDMGFLVKLDTNGNNPLMLRELLRERLLDYIAMDIKTSLARYKSLVGNRAKIHFLQESIYMIQQSGIDHEFRSTLIKEIHTDDVLLEMIELLCGAGKLYLQSFRPETTLVPAFATYHPFSSQEMNDIADRFREIVQEVVVR